MDKNTIIETLDYLFEKFGIAVDWTTENVMPYVEQLAEKIVTYKIVTNSIGVVLSILAIIGCCVYVRVLYGNYKLCNTTKKDTLLVDYLSSCDCTDFSVVGFICTIVFGGVAVASVICLLVDGADLIKWILLPELQLIEYVGNLVSNAQM